MLTVLGRTVKLEERALGARVAAVLVTVALLLSAGPGPSRPASSGSDRPQLVLLIAVDGLSWETLWGNRRHLRAGLDRLLREGLVEHECRYKHINTETAPGHAAIVTGAPPRVTGIVANLWYEPGPDGKMESVSAVAEPNGSLGPGRLLVPTMGDRLVQRNPRSRVVSLAGKERSAILLAGRSRQHFVYWLDRKSARFVTTPAYDASLDWHRTANRIVSTVNDSVAGTALERRFGGAWIELRREDSTDPRLLPFQIPVLGRGFPHGLRLEKEGYPAGFYMSPYSDELLADLGLALLSDPELRLGRRGEPDMLCIAFSALDHIAHRYGPESEESLDVLARLDIQIGRLLEGAERALPRNRIVVALTADHGFLPLGGVKRNPAGQGRLLQDPFVGALNRGLSAELCLDPGSRPIFAVESWNLYYNRSALPLRSVGARCGPGERTVNARELDAVLPKVISKEFGDSIAEVRLATESARRGLDPVVQFARNAYYPVRSGDAILFPRPGEMMHWDSRCRGTNHGSHHEYDIHVPLVLWGATFEHSDATAPTTPYDLAPTLAGLLGVTLPDAVGHAVPSAVKH